MLSFAIRLNAFEGGIDIVTYMGSVNFSRLLFSSIIPPFVSLIFLMELLAMTISQILRTFIKKVERKRSYLFMVGFL